MAILKYRLRRKNTEGQYDVLHLETQASEVLRYTVGGAANGTVESALSALETNSANKVTSATSGNFASLTAAGDLADSGKKAADFAAAEHNHDLSDLVSDTIKGKALITNTSGAVADSGVTATEIGYVAGVTSSIQTQLDNKLETSLKGANNGLAELDSTGKVPSSQLPSYVDDVLEFANRDAFPATGETGKIYVAKDTNLTYRWGGSDYVEISASLALGETESTAYRGDRGAAAYAHSIDDTKHVPAATATGKVLKSVDGAQATWQDEAELSKGTTPATDTGNVVTDIEVDGHTVTLRKGATAILENDPRLSDARTPLSHTHGNITNDGKLANSGKVVVTDANGNIDTASYDASSVVLTNDSRLSDARTPLSHAHGNISNDGAIASDATIANGDKLAIIDASDGNKVARASVAFDGATTSKALSQAGTFETFLQASDIADKADKSATVSTVAYDGTNKKITKTINGTTSDVVSVAQIKSDMDTMGAASASAAGSKGLVPAPAKGDQDKFLNGAGEWATPYTHPTYTAKTNGFYKVTVDGTGHVSGTTAVVASDITALGFVEASFAASEPTNQQTNGLWFETIT